MAVNASWPIPETANSAAGTGCRLSHGGVWCGDCRRAGNRRYALSANHGAQYASTHGSMGRAAIDRLCTPQEGAAGTYTPIGRAPGRHSQNRRVICEAASNTSRKKHSARSRSHVSTSLRGALATKQSILRLLHSRRPWIASLTLAMTSLGCLKIESARFVVRERVIHHSSSRPPSRDP